MRMRAAVWCCLMFGIISASMRAQQVPSAASPLAACGDENATFSVTRGPVGDSGAAPTADSATVYIIELDTVGDKGSPTVRQGLDGSWLGATQASTYVTASVKPGIHHLCSRWQSSLKRFSRQISLYNFEAAAGRRYYFRAQLLVEGAGDGAMPASIDLQPVSEDEGRFLISQAAQSISKPAK